ncbi:hypothetical protein D3C81_544310 [compost metagenome]
MNEAELKIYIEQMNRLKEEITSSPEKSRDFLQRAGIIDKNGVLAEQYGGEGERT